MKSTVTSLVVAAILMVMFYLWVMPASRLSDEDYIGGAAVILMGLIMLVGVHLK